MSNNVNDEYKQPTIYHQPQYVSASTSPQAPIHYVSDQQYISHQHQHQLQPQPQPQHQQQQQYNHQYIPSNPSRKVRFNNNNNNNYNNYNNYNNNNNIITTQQCNNCNNNHLNVYEYDNNNNNTSSSSLLSHSRSYTYTYTASPSSSSSNNLSSIIQQIQPPQHQQYLHSNPNPNPNQYGLHTLPIVVPKSISSDDTNITNHTLSNGNFPTPTITPNSSLGVGYHQHHNIIDTHSQHSTHSGQTQNTLALLPSIKYYSNQHSNFSNTSNGTNISSTTNQSNATSIHSGFSDPSTMQTMHHHQQPSNPPLFDISPQSHSQSDTQQMAIINHPYDAPMYHHYHQQSQQQIIPRSSTGNIATKINLLELDDEVQTDIIAKIDDNHSNHNDDEKKSPKQEQKEQQQQQQQKQKHERKSTKQLELKEFDGNIRAYNTWISCVHSDQSNVSIFFYILYPKLCGYFRDIVGSQKCPTPNDLRPVFTRHGAVAHKYQNDNNNTYLSIDKAHFITFWKWYKECCEIIKELRYLWDDNHNTINTKDNNKNNNKDNKEKVINNNNNDNKEKIINGLGLNFFCQRAVCEANLLQSIQGTFGLRLSSSISGGVVLSYVENNYSDIHKPRGCKHVILIRQKTGMYLCNKKTLSLHDIIRNFVKLKFLYTPNRPIPKEKIF